MDINAIKQRLNALQSSQNTGKKEKSITQKFTGNQNKKVSTKFVLYLQN
jgi:hypothetical protein